MGHVVSQKTMWCLGLKIFLEAVLSDRTLITSCPKLIFTVWKSGLCGFHAE